MSRSLKRIDPPDGVMLPDRRLMSVVLPAPLGPRIACTRPRAIAIETSSTAARPPKRRVSPRVSSTTSAIAVALGGAQRTTEQAGDAARQEEHDREHEHAH